jgi:hypothetical protein
MKSTSMQKKKQSKIRSLLGWAKMIKYVDLHTLELECLPDLHFLRTNEV